MYLKFFLSNFDRVSLSSEKNNFAYLCAFTPSLFNYKYRTLVGVEGSHRINWKSSASGKNYNKFRFLLFRTLPNKINWQKLK